MKHRHAFLAGRSPPTIRKLFHIYMSPPRLILAVVAAISAPLLDGVARVRRDSPDLGNFLTGRAEAFARLARPDLTLWPKNTWNPWIACNWVYAEIKSGFPRICEILAP